MKALADRIKEIEAELHNLEARRQGLLAAMREIRSADESPELRLGKGTPGTNEEKIDLFLSLFGARRSVYPKLWINLKKGSKGYSPACSNEWVPGVCEKSRLKCSDCPNQNFPPLDHSVIQSHLIGRHTIRHPDLAGKWMDAENRTSGGVEDSRGAIPVSPSNPSFFDRRCRAE